MLELPHHVRLVMIGPPPAAVPTADVVFVVVALPVALALVLGAVVFVTVKVY